MNKLILVSILLFNQLAFGECEKPVTYLKTGDTTTCSGYLFTPEEEKKVREFKIKYTQQVELIQKQDDLNKVLTERLVNQTEQNQYLNKRIESIESGSTLEKVIYFGLGIALGVGISQVVK